MRLALSSDTSYLHFFFWNFLNEEICADDFKTIKKLKDAIVSEISHSHSQMVDRPLTDQGTTRLPAVTFMQFCRPPIKYSGAALYDGARSTQCIIFSQFLNMPPGPADRLDTIQDHQLFLVALIIFRQSAEPN